MQKNSSSEWAIRIRHLFTDLNLTQAALAERVGFAPAKPSLADRWGARNRIWDAEVARFQLVSGPDLPVSANYKFVPINVSHAAKRRVFGGVFWWTPTTRNPEPPIKPG